VALPVPVKAAETVVAIRKVATVGVWFKETLPTPDSVPKSEKLI
jgi:hypothetical protein